MGPNMAVPVRAYYVCTAARGANATRRSSIACGRVSRKRSPGEKFRSLGDDGREWEHGAFVYIYDDPSVDCFFRVKDKAPPT